MDGLRWSKAQALERAGGGAGGGDGGGGALGEGLVGSGGGAEAGVAPAGPGPGAALQTVISGEVFRTGSDSDDSLVE